MIVVVIVIVIVIVVIVIIIVVVVVLILILILIRHELGHHLHQLSLGCHQLPDLIAIVLIVLSAGICMMGRHMWFQ